MGRICDTFTWGLNSACLFWQRTKIDKLLPANRFRLEVFSNVRTMNYCVGSEILNPSLLSHWVGSRKTLIWSNRSPNTLLAWANVLSELGTGRRPCSWSKTHGLKDLWLSMLCHPSLRMRACVAKPCISRGCLVAKKLEIFLGFRLGFYSEAKAWNWSTSLIRDLMFDYIGSPI